MQLVTFNNTRWYMPEDKLVIDEDYAKDKLAWYEEFSLGHVTNSIAYSRWGVACCEIDDNSDLATVLLALTNAEEASRL